MPGKPKHIEALVRDQIRAARAYHTPPADGLIKLDAMENPYQLPAELKSEWLARLGEVKVNRYPDPRCETLIPHLRAALSIKDDCAVALGNGSDELIQMIAMLVGGGRVLLAPTPSFSMYQLIANTVGGEFVGVPLREDFSLDGDAMRAAMEQHQPACVFIAYPNNPTGNRFHDAAVEKIITHAPGLVVVDEAYFPFCRRSFIDRIARCPDVLVLRTLSKNGMAGLRLGVAAGHPDWIAQLEKVRLPYNINSLTQASAQFYLEHYTVLQRQAELIVAEREAVFAQLNNLPGVHAYPSEANFILFSVDDADAVHRRLQQEGVLIKNLQPTPALQNHLRVTIGTESENQRFIQALRMALAE